MKVEYYQNLKDKIVVIGGDHHAQAMVDAIEAHLLNRKFKIEKVPFKNS